MIVSHGHPKVRLHVSRMFGFGKRALLEKGSFQKSPFSRDSKFAEGFHIR